MELKIRENFISFINEKILPKAKLNEVTGQNEIKYEDYQEFELSVGEKKLLREICNNLGIKLQTRGYLRQNLVCIEDEELFKEYNDIKDKLSTNITEEEKRILEQRKHQIIDKIVTDNIPYIETIINRRIANINNRTDKDEIYQLGYIMLFHYIHKNYLYKGKFKNDIGEQLILYITHRLSPKNTTDNSQKQNNHKPKQQINTEKTTLYYDGFEDKIVDSICQNEIIPMIISTMPQRDQTILKLYFGFNGETYTIIEIADMYNISKQLISQIIITFLETIRNSIRMKYINQISNKEIPYQTQDNYQNKKLEEFLIKNLPQEYLAELLKGLISREKNLANIFFSDKEYTTAEMGSLLNISPSYASATKNKLILHIRYKIIEQLTYEHQTEITYEEYIDYLMKIYQKQYILKRGK